MRALALAGAAVAVAGCPGPDDACDVPAWGAVADQRDGALLSVQGGADGEVWAVGGGLGLGGALARRWDGDRWHDVDLARAPDDPRSLWWVWPDPGAPGHAWLVGEQGRIVQLGDGGAVARDAATGATLYGAWGAAADDVWIVGGVADGEATGDDDLVLRWDGAALTRVDVPARGAALFKVWGAAADDVWVSGQGGTMLHWDGAAWTDHSDELATAAPALTVHGCGPDEVYAVAGQTLHAWDGAAWAAVADAPITSTVNGVACAPGEAGGVLVVGNGGLRLRRPRGGPDAGSWIDERLDGPWDTDYHGAWLDADGGAWAAGGNFIDPTPTERRGVLAFRGCPRPGAW